MACHQNYDNLVVDHYFFLYSREKSVRKPDTMVLPVRFSCNKHDCNDCFELNKAIAHRLQCLVDNAD